MTIKDELSALKYGAILIGGAIAVGVIIAMYRSNKNKTISTSAEENKQGGDKDKLATELINFVLPVSPKKQTIINKVSSTLSYSELEILHKYYKEMKDFQTMIDAISGQTNKMEEAGRVMSQLSLITKKYEDKYGKEYLTNLFKKFTLLLQ